MIRKILIIFAIVFSVIWFSVAYLLKVRAASQIENLKLNNIELSYDKISVTGFPSVWQVKVKDPKLKFLSSIDSKEISTSEIMCIFDLSFKKAELVIKDKIIQEQDFGQQKTHYYLSSSKPIVANLKFTKPFYKLKNDSNIVSSIKFFALGNVNLSASFQNEKIFNINDLSINLSKSLPRAKQDTALKVHASYQGQNYLLGVNSARLNLDSAFTDMQDNASEGATLRNVYKINKFELDIDDDSTVNLSGSLENYSDKPPEGQFIVSLSNSAKIIDKLVHANFIVPKSTLKQIVAEQGRVENIVQNNIEQVKTIFQLNLSQAGVKIGSVNLFDISKDSSDIDNEIEG